jgi:glycosyltransferase involved in cell wall biosynthesis
MTTMSDSARDGVLISVIIPTTCEEGRWASLQRAIASVGTQQGVEVRMIVVVNGDRVAPHCLSQLRAMPNMTVLNQALGSAPLAQRLGRQAVQTEYFCFLDDDDEYLPGGLWHRVQPMLADASLAFTASNGYRALDGRDRLAVQRSSAIATGPLEALCDENWLSSCGGLYRSAAVGADYFDNPAPFYEWTYLAYKLARALPMAWVDAPTFRINDTPSSLSKSGAFRASEAQVLERILALGLPETAARPLRLKIGRTYHGLASESIDQGRPGPAWRYHIKSLRQPGGWRYLLYTRKLLAMALAKVAR